MRQQPLKHISSFSQSKPFINWFSSFAGNIIKCKTFHQLWPLCVNPSRVQSGLLLLLSKSHTLNPSDPTLLPTIGFAYFMWCSECCDDEELEERKVASDILQPREATTQDSINLSQSFLLLGLSRAYAAGY
ncbi:hypothetical protein MANES_05G063250v8 [Manihot esculenta]|uniref:Uncharacterized protein n=1 Tax=Manihot esculenta TaxID=3983 RepID=A0ACB7HMK1_MANES|nr:hypothetical protein MANES_05G063250v8 [Manihot esculenta]